MRKNVPPVIYFLMIAALAAILLVPSTLDSLRTIQKYFFFATSQVLFLLLAYHLLERVRIAPTAVLSGMN